jgi:hypothetical protein
VKYPYITIHRPNDNAGLKVSMLVSKPRFSCSHDVLEDATVEVNAHGHIVVKGNAVLGGYLWSYTTKKHGHYILKDHTQLEERFSHKVVLPIKNWFGFKTGEFEAYVYKPQPAPRHIGDYEVIERERVPISFESSLFTIVKNPTVDYEKIKYK